MEQGAYSVLLQMPIQLVLRPQGLRVLESSQGSVHKAMCPVQDGDLPEKEGGSPYSTKASVHLPRQGHLLKICACRGEGRNRVCVCF